LQENWKISFEKLILFVFLQPVQGLVAGKLAAHGPLEIEADYIRQRESENQTKYDNTIGRSPAISHWWPTKKSYCVSGQDLRPSGCIKNATPLDIHRVLVEAAEEMDFDWPEFLTVERIKNGMAEVALGFLVLAGLTALGWLVLLPPTFLS
jgi:hypothetical protein